MSDDGTAAFDRAAGQLDYPMIIVTAAADGERSGCLVGFHTQCSIDPVRFLACVSRNNHTAGVAARSEHLGVHFLDRADHRLAELFGERTGDDVDKFARCEWREEHGVPVLTGSRAWFVGRVLDRLPLGDHDGYLLQPVAGHVDGPLRQLSFQQVREMDPGHEA